MTLDQMLDTWVVFEPGSWMNDDGPTEWWAVANDDGIVAYFASETAAFRHRLDMINRVLNPGTE